LDFHHSCIRLKLRQVLARFLTQQRLPKTIVIIV